MTSHAEAKHSDSPFTPGYLVLEDGTRFEGRLLGAARVGIGEAVFTTGMTGYEEVLTDPSYCGQLVTMTSPHIGNTGINIEDGESQVPQVSGFILHQEATVVSNWRAAESLDAYLERNDIPAITRVDTRALTRHIRSTGAQMAAFGAKDPQTLHDMAKSAPPITGQDLTQRVSTSDTFVWSEGLGAERLGQPKSDTVVLPGELSGKGQGKHIVAVDFGVKRNILRCLVDAGFRVTVVPGTANKDQILAHHPDGIFLSNGPGDPAAVTKGVETTKALLGHVPLFAICLGHQVLCQALGGSTYKLKFGHRGLNQPVKDLETGRIEITTQNHGFCVDLDSLAGKCRMTHVHLNDGTCEGIEHAEAKAFSVQYHPEAGAGPRDSRYLFERFAERIEAWK